jgi:hypothetical protein
MLKNKVILPQCLSEMFYMQLYEFIIRVLEKSKDLTCSPAFFRNFYWSGQELNSQVGAKLKEFCQDKPLNFLRNSIILTLMK